MEVLRPSELNRHPYVRQAAQLAEMLTEALGQWFVKSARGPRNLGLHTLYETTSALRLGCHCHKQGRRASSWWDIDKSITCYAALLHNSCDMVYEVSFARLPPSNYAHWYLPVSHSDACASL